MRIIALGDTHGRMHWKNIIQRFTFDKLVFAGDYFDSREDISAEDQLNNFIEILAYKKRHPDKVVLLLGNHDFHYLADADVPYGGYQEEHAESFHKFLQPAVDKAWIQVAWQWENLLFSHAGVTNTWCQNYDIETDNLVDTLQSLFKEDPLAFDLVLLPASDPKGDNVYQSPMWVRPQSLIKDGLKEYLHIVGHTQTQRIFKSENCIFIDALNSEGGQFLVWDDGKIQIGTI